MSVRWEPDAEPADRQDVPAGTAADYAHRRRRAVLAAVLAGLAGILWTGTVAWLMS